MAQTGLKPSEQAQVIAQRTWQDVGPSMDPDKRLRIAVEAAFAQHRSDAPTWMALVMVAMICLTILGSVFLATR